MSLNGASEFRFRLRNSGGDVASGYSATGGYVSNASYMIDSASTTGFDAYGLGSAGYTWSAHLKLKLPTDAIPRDRQQHLPSVKTEPELHQKQGPPI